MTAPIISASDSFSFAMPTSYPLESTPAPLDPRSVIERIPKRRVAVLRSSGTAPTKTIGARSHHRLDTLARHEVRTKGSPFLMRYNPPFTSGFMRLNEIGVELASPRHSGRPRG